MNTKSKRQDQARPRQINQQNQKLKSAKPGEKTDKHEHERPETRLTR
jgi:hypothetical protein